MAGPERLITQTLVDYEPPLINGGFAGKHILSVEQFQRGDLEELFSDARKIEDAVKKRKPVGHLCEGYVLANLFFEASTRTDLSFQAAMRRLGGDVIVASNGVQFSSVYKGENLPDTIRAVGCYADVIVLRHPDIGSTYIAARALDKLNEKTGTVTTLISGGDGIGEHPSQALLDLFTIEYKKGTGPVIITMVGDLNNGRTVHSLAKLLAVNGFSSVHVNFVSPDQLRIPQEISEYMERAGITIYETSNLLEVLGDTDVIYWTRIQEERFPNKEEYDAIKDSFIMTPDVLAKAKPDAILMHPLPRKHEMGTEEDHEILDADPRSVYFDQMENGMYVRMALLRLVLGVKYLIP